MLRIIRSDRGGISWRQLHILGLNPKKLTKGWLKRLLGRSISERAYRKLVYIRKKEEDIEDSRVDGKTLGFIIVRCTGCRLISSIHLRDKYRRGGKCEYGKCSGIWIRVKRLEKVILENVLGIHVEVKGLSCSQSKPR